MTRFQRFLWWANGALLRFLCWALRVDKFEDDMDDGEWEYLE